MKPWLMLNIGAAKRLEWLRSHGRHVEGGWRKIRSCGFDNWHSYVAALSRGMQSDGTPVWYTHVGAEFRGEQFADECEDAPRYIRENRGWYTDGPEMNETARGIVARLPHGRYIAGYYLSMNGERVYFPDVHDCEREAAIAANEHARVIGERESEYQERFQAALRLRDNIAQSLMRLRECIRLRHDKCMAYVLDEIPELIESIRGDRDTLATDYADIES